MTIKKVKKNEKAEEMFSFLQTPTWIIFDIETTARTPNPIYGKIIEIAAIKVKDGQIVDTFEELIDPQMKISSTITSLTGITNDMVNGKKRFEEVIPEFLKFCEGDCVIMGHNIATFDIRFVHFFANLIGQSFQPEKVVDTLVLAKASDPNKYCECYKLEYLANYFGVEDKGHHRAMNDVMVNFRVGKILYTKLKDMGYNNSTKLTTKKNDIKVAEAPKSGMVIRSANLWEKEISGKFYSRLYVTLYFEGKYSKVFYDFLQKKWGNKEALTFPVDYSEVENQLATKYRCSKQEVKNVNIYKGGLV